MLFSSSSHALAAALVLAPLALAAPATSPNPALYERSLNTGVGTWYGESCGEEACWQQGACAFVDYVLPSTIDGSTCVSETIWANGQDCGGCVSITYKGGAKKIAMVGNIMSEYSKHHTNPLTRLPTRPVVTRTTWTCLPTCSPRLPTRTSARSPFSGSSCLAPSPMVSRSMHGGASQYWFAATVFNARLRTFKLEVSADSGKTWKATTRNVNNYFALAGNGGTGTKTAWVRATSENGDSVIVKDVDMTSGKTTKSTVNYKA
jgi:hypothetical protein